MCSLGALSVIAIQCRRLHGVSGHRKFCPGFSTAAVGASVCLAKPSTLFESWPSLLSTHSNGGSRSKAERIGGSPSNIIHGKVHLYLNSSLFSLLEVIKEWINIVVVMLRVMTTPVSDAIIIPLISNQEQAHSNPYKNWIPAVRGV